MGTASIPGSGISYRHHFSNTHSNLQTSPGGIPYLPPSPAGPTPSPTPGWSIPNTAAVEEVHSASTELLTSATLQDLKQFIQTAYQQHSEVARDLDEARTAKAESQYRFDAWDQGLLLKNLFKKAYAKRREAFETDTVKVAEFEEQLRLSKISASIELEGEQSALYCRMRDEFAAACECVAIWDVKSHQATDMVRERTVASTRISRERVRFELGNCGLIDWDQKVPHLRNAKGGDLYLYPGFVLYRGERDAFSLIEYQDITGVAKNIRFHEEDGVPSDSQIVGSTWAKANKDGSRDRRFANNYQIPVVQYGLLTLRSANGLWEEFHFSNLDRLVKWLTAFNAFTHSYAAVPKEA